MKIITNKPAPVVQPPTTYDITGLTRAELEHITIAVGELNKFSHDSAKSRRSEYRESTHLLGASIFVKLRDTLNACE